MLYSDLERLNGLDNVTRHMTEAGDGSLPALPAREHSFAGSILAGKDRLGRHGARSYLTQTKRGANGLPMLSSASAPLPKTLAIGVRKPGSQGSEPSRLSEAEKLAIRDARRWLRGVVIKSPVEEEQDRPSHSKMLSRSNSKSFLFATVRFLPCCGPAFLCFGIRMLGR